MICLFLLDESNPKVHGNAADKQCRMESLITWRCRCEVHVASWQHLQLPSWHKIQDASFNKQVEPQSTGPMISPTIWLLAHKVRLTLSKHYSFSIRLCWMNQVIFVLYNEIKSNHRAHKTKRRMKWKTPGEVLHSYNCYLQRSFLHLPVHAPPPLPAQIKVTHPWY